MTHGNPRYDKEQKAANLAWERWNPDKVSKPEYEVEASAWRSGYIAALSDEAVHPAASTRTDERGKTEVLDDQGNVIGRQG